MQKEKKKIQDSLMKILLSKELKDIKMSEILSHAKLKSKKVQYLYESKEEIIICFFKRIDLTMKKKVQKIKLSRNIKDNLFEICMTRLDILNMHKNNIVFRGISSCHCLIDESNVKINLFFSLFLAIKAWSFVQ